MIVGKEEGLSMFLLSYDSSFSLDSDVVVVSCAARQEIRYR
jgi:hypothetical protein